MKKPLGKLQRVDLREVWDNESRSFTPWLALPENISLLGESIGLELEVQAQERSIGPFRADIVCKDLGTDKTVLIENQIEMTDHNHLGQLLTYAAGLDAAVVVWIAKEFAAEHRAALDWMNERMAGNAHFFGVEVEVLKIGNSDPAPRFNVVCRPNDWQDQVRRGGADLSDNDRLRMEYWSALDTYLKRNGSVLRCGKISSGGWQGVRSVVRGYNCGFWLGLQDNWVSVSIGSGDEAQKDLLKKLFPKIKKAVEAESKLELELYGKDQAKWCSITTGIEVDPSDRADWKRQHEWLRLAGEELARSLPQYLQQREGDAE